MFCPRCGNDHVTQVAQGIYQCSSDPVKFHKKGVKPGDLSCGYIDSANKFLTMLTIGHPVSEVKELGLPRRDLACPECQSTSTRKKGQWVRCEACYYRNTEDYFFSVTQPS